MTPENFAFWLQGFVELTQGQTPNPAQWKSICEHLDLVFKKLTPPVAPLTVPTTTKPIDWAEMQRIFRNEPWPNPPYTVTCDAGQSKPSSVFLC